MSGQHGPLAGDVGHPGAIVAALRTAGVIA